VVLLFLWTLNFGLFLLNVHPSLSRINPCFTALGARMRFWIHLIAFNSVPQWIKCSENARKPKTLMLLLFTLRVDLHWMCDNFWYYTNWQNQNKYVDNYLQKNAFFSTIVHTFLLLPLFDYAEIGF
jgi:hypothetical protein